ncbi:MAG: hypothetical protein V1833_07425 [Elusimicrobiota bacterium]
MKKKQIEFIVTICEKNVIYLLTIAIIGQALKIQISIPEIVILVGIVIIVFIIGLKIAGLEEEK